MLPDIRVVLGALVAAIGLMTISFALVAAFRVAQDTRIGVLQADLAQRGRSFIPTSQESRPALPVERPAPLEAIPVRAVEIQEAPEIPAKAPETPLAVVLAAPQGELPAPEFPVTELPVTELLATEVPAIKPPLTEPPMGGPLPDEAANRSAPPAPKAVDDTAVRKAKKKAAQAAAAKKKRAQRLARERKAAAQKARAALARAKQQSVSSFDNVPPGNSFGTSTIPLPNGTFGNGTFGTSARGQ